MTFKLIWRFQNELQDRKNYMKMQDVERYKSEQLNDLEEEERQKSEELRQKAFEQVEEQEDEIKRLNEVRCVLWLPRRWHRKTPLLTAHILNKTPKLVCMISNSKIAVRYVNLTLREPIAAFIKLYCIVL